MRLTPVVFAAVLALAGCASLPPNVDRTASKALPDPERTPLGRAVAEATPKNAASGFKLLVSGEEAYRALLTLSTRAQRTLDLQYYIVREDESARAILASVRDAAGRGVRVRLLVDDLYTAGRDLAFLRYASHRNIEVRFFNPFAAARSTLITRLLTSGGEVERLNRRMHNKLFIADNALAVTGGRNLGDEYFVPNDKNNFVDLDVLVAGRAVRELSNVFDHYWNDSLAYPVEALQPRNKSASTNKPTTEVAAEVKPPAVEPVPLKLVWVPAKVLADAPSKVTDTGPVNPATTIADDLAAMLRTAREEVLVISPYLVPGEKGMALIRELRARGVKVRMLTNSLAATDAPIVHVGYARYRKDMLRAGVELFEMRSTLAQPTTSRFGAFGSSHASLHAKALIVDRRTLFVGSMNMDPRSAEKNTELGLIVPSAELANEAVRLFEEVSAQASYRVELTEDGGRLRWVGGTPGAERTYDDEPEASAALRFKLLLLTPFAPESML